MTDFHFIRPWWLFSILPVLWLFWSLWRQSPRLEAWAAVCDGHLLEHLMQEKGQGRRHFALICLLLSLLSMCIALTGPTWSRLPVPTYKQIQPKVIVLDLSDAMLANDLKPDRLTRAKFKLHDLFKRRIGQFGLIAYTGEPFVVAPLTDDAQTIDALLSSLSPEIMPVEGQQLETALKEAAQLIANAGFKQGQILVLTGETPTLAAIATAKSLAEKKVYTSIMPVLANKTVNSLFQDLATAGQGELIPFSDTSADLDQWLNSSNNKESFSLSEDNDIPLWRDQGRWFLIPALLLLLPVFRRGWLQRITT
ncbi:MAG: VWA domain-containing protein [Tatlockia sp.]|nr:VWA domain-containing protein [Tatlockia sp.]